MKSTQTMTSSVGCVKSATSILGDKWTPQLLRHIANEGAVRFCHLQELVGTINPRTLSSRLSTLEERAIITRTSDSHGSRYEYSLTERGRDLLPILHDMQVWGERYDSGCSSDKSQ